MFMLRLEDRPAIRDALEVYCSGPWSHWSELRSTKTIHRGISAPFSKSHSDCSQSGGSESIELLGNRSRAVETPCRVHRSSDDECGVEIEIAETGNAEITVRPRSGVTRVELRPFEKLAGARFVLAEDAARRCLRSLEGPDSDGVSPFRAETLSPS